MTDKILRCYAPNLNGKLLYYKDCGANAPFTKQLT